MSIEDMRTRLYYLGGDANSRIKKQKLRSFQASLLNSYNSRKVKLPDGTIWPAILNLSNLKPDYDKKYISIAYESMLEAGDVVQTIDDKAHWMIYLPDLAETAYLRSEIIRCRYTLTINDNKYWVYFQGPTETDVRWSLNHGLTYNELNLSGTIFIKNNPEVKEYFSRFTKFKIAEHTWEAQVVDYISVPGIIEVEVQEYFENTAEELPEIIKEPPTIIDNEVIKYIISGKQEVDRNTTVGYSIPEELLDTNKVWKVLGNENVKIINTHLEGRICEVEIADCAIGTFTICYGDDNAIEVKINSLEPEIYGPTEVYPYETYNYQIHGIDGYYEIFSPLAKIINDDKAGNCTIEITSSKKGSFILFFNSPLTGDKISLPIKIKSL